MAIADEAYRQQLGTLYWTERAISNPLKWAIFIAAFALTSYWAWDGIGPTVAVTLILYAVQNTVFTLLFLRDSFPLRVAKLLALASYTLDFLFVGFLIFGLGGGASQVAFLLYVTLIFKSGLHYPVLKESLFVLPLAILMYLALLGLREGLDVFTEPSMKPRMFLLLGIPAITIYTARLVERRHHDVLDLNARLRAKTVELRRQTEELQAVIEGMHDGLLVTDSLLNLITANPVARGILRLRTDDRLPLPLDAGENGQSLVGLVCEALHSPRRLSRWDVALRVEGTGEGETRHFQALASHMPGENELGSQVVVILRDITEQRQLEAAKSDFLSVISHELRTPLSSIKGFLNLILSGRAGPLNGNQRDFFATIAGQVEFLHVMINDIVEFSRIQVRRTQLDMEPVSLFSISRGVCTRLMPLAEEKHLAVLNQVPEWLACVAGDQLRLDQVVSNLVANAIKFTPDGGTITVTAQDMEQQVTLSVADTGVGVPRDQQEKIFEHFYQVSRGPARLYGGMGLGLAICRSIVMRHGGQLTVESEEGQGSTFHVTLAKYATTDSAAPEPVRLSDASVS